METEIHQVAPDVSRHRRKLTPDEIGQLIAFLAVILGAFLYLYPAYLAGFPINDGGMFYTMIRALQANGLRLPAYVQYNGLSIPFAYPPLGFYVGAALSTLLRLDPLVVLQWFPAVVLVPVSVAVYSLALRIFKSPLEAGIATFLYVCTPRSMTWLVMGGGLTRSLGQLFLVLTLASVYSLYTGRRRKHLALAIVFGSLAVLTHPEAAIHAAALCLLFFIFKGRSRQGVIDSLAVATGVLVLTSIWWLPALLHYGLSPFLAAAQTGGSNASSVLVYVGLVIFTEEPLTTVVAVLGLIGLAACVARRDYLLPMWLVVPFAVEPRSAATVAVIPVVLMAALALHEVVLPGIAAVQRRTRGPSFESYPDTRAAQIGALYLGLCMLVLAFYAATQLAIVRVSEANRAAFEWVAAHTPPDSRFLVMTGDIELFCDPVQEWFPALTRRVSATTLQGLEWSPNGDFYSKIVGLPRLQACLGADSPIDCIGQRAPAMGLRYDYIYVAKAATLKRFCRPLVEDQRRGTALVMQLESSAQYVSVYNSQDVKIFAVNH